MQEIVWTVTIHMLIHSAFSALVCNVEDKSFRIHFVLAVVGTTNLFVLLHIESREVSSGLL